MQLLTPSFAGGSQHSGSIFSGPTYEVTHSIDLLELPVAVAFEKIDRVVSVFALSIVYSQWTPTPTSSP
jgi:hypothetical protein